MLCSSKTCCLIEKWQSCNARRPNPNVSRGLESVGGNLVRWRIEKIFLLFIFPIKLVSSAYPKYHPNSVLYNTVGKTWTWKLFFLKAPQSFLIVDKKLTMKTNLSWREKSDLQNPFYLAISPKYTASPFVLLLSLLLVFFLFKMSRANLFLVSLSSVWPNYVVKGKNKLVNKIETKSTYFLTLYKLLWLPAEKLLRLQRFWGYLNQ